MMGLLFTILMLINPLADWTDHTKQQADEYLNVILSQEDGRFGLHFWALNEIFFSNCEVQEYIGTRLRNTGFNTYYSSYRNKCVTGIADSVQSQKLRIIRDVALDTGNANLLIYFFLSNKYSKKTGDVLDAFFTSWGAEIPESEYALLKKVQAKEVLDQQVLSFEDNLLIHFALLFSSNRKELFSEGYQKQSLKSWALLEKSIDNKKSLEYSVLVSNIIKAGYDLYNNEVIREYYKSFLETSLFPNCNLKVRMLNFIDYTNYILGHYDESLSIQRNHSLPLTTFLGEEKAKDQIMMRHGAYLFSLGKYKESKNIYEELHKKERSYVSKSVLFNNLSINYVKLGHKNKYLSFQLRALQTFSEEENYRILLGIYKNLVIHYTSENDITTALSYINEARKVATSVQDSTELATIDSYLGTFYWNVHRDFESAMSYLNSAEKILSSGENYRRYTELLFEKATIFEKTDQLEEAKHIFSKIRDLSLEKSDTPNYLASIIGLSRIALKQDKLNIANNFLEEIKLYPLDNLDFETLVRFYTVKADYFYKIEDARLAIAELEPVITQIIERAKNSSDTQTGYWTVQEEYLEAFSSMINYLKGTGHQEKALLLLDQLKTINDASLYNNPLVKAAKLSEEQLAEEKRLNDQLQSLRKKYLNAPENERFNLKIQIDRISAERQEIMNQVNSGQQEELAPFWAIRNNISEKELILHFTEVGSDLYISQLTSEETSIRKIPLTKSLQEKLKNAANKLSSGKTDLYDLYEIYELLNFDEIPHQIESIAVIPDNYLYRIPLELLPVEKPTSSISYGSTRYLIEDYHFQYYTSLSEYINNRREPSSDYNLSNGFTAFAISDFEDFSSVRLPSLPYATIEANNISDLLTSFEKKKVYTGNKATKEAFKQEVSSSRVIHIATHSEISEQDPLFSTIYLKSEKQSDTLESSQALYAYELFDTPLSSELVMLNSCSSGSGNYIEGSGIMGISRALRYAGAHSLALNLWSVNDKVAAEFAADFYNYVNQGKTKSEAVRLAKLNRLKTGNANPHFWGAYMLIGNPSPMAKKPVKPLLLFSILGISILLAGFSARKQ